MIEWLLTSLWWMCHDMKSEWPGIFIKDHIQIGIYRGATIFGSFAGSFSGPKIISLSEVFFSNFKVELEGANFRGPWSWSCLKEAIGFWGSELLKDKVYMTLSCVCGLWEEMRFSVRIISVTINQSFYYSLLRLYEKDKNEKTLNWYITTGNP